MPTPIPFSVPAARRSGTFQTPAMTMPAGYSLLRFTLVIPNAAEYEDPANSFTSEVHVVPPGGTDGVYQTAGWSGSRVLGKDGTADPSPVISVGVDDIPVGASVYVRIILTGTYTVGIANGLLS